MTNTSIQAVYLHLDEALNAYHNPNKLASNPLAKLLKIDRTTKAESEQESYAEITGTALRNHLDSVIDRVTIAGQHSVLQRQGWKPEDYLHLRYRKCIPRAVIAQSLGYSEPHMQRLRNELMLNATELICQQAA